MRERTGLVLDPYFSGTKIAVAAARTSTGCAERARDGRAVFGTIDAWLIWNLTGEHVTDPSNASRTLLYDMRDGRLVRRAAASCSACPSARCPRIAPSIGEIGRVSGEALPGHGGVPVAGVAGDQQAALYGQACLDPGHGEEHVRDGLVRARQHRRRPPPVPPPGLLATVAWGIGQRRIYALEASIFVTGAAVQWLRDGLGHHRAARARRRRSRRRWTATTASTSSPR